MHFVKLNAEGQPDEWPVTLEKIRFDNPQISFPADPSAFDFSEWGYQPYALSDKPEFDPYMQEVAEVTPTLTDGVWYQSWMVTEKYPEDERPAKKEEHDAILLAEKGDGKRAERDAALFETDWVAIKAFETGTTVDEAMATYRQGLRDVPQQEGFPDSINWPTKPTE